MNNKLQKIKNSSVSILLVLIFLILLIFLTLTIFERISRKGCAQDAAKYTRSLGSKSLIDYQRAYNLVYDSCMNKKGYK